MQNGGKTRNLSHNSMKNLVAHFCVQVKVILKD